MPERTPVVIAVFNTKGGVGKTTTAVNLSAALAAPRRRVLLIDLDSQASASLWCGVSRATLRPSSASCLIDKYPILKAVRHTPTPHLDIVPGSMELANVDVALCSLRGRELALDRLLRPLDGHYDIIMLDCPPGMSLLAVNALFGAQALVVPVAPEPLALAALEHMLNSVEGVRSRLGFKSSLVGILLTMVDTRRAHVRDVMDRIRAQYRDKVFHTEVRWAAGLSSAPLSGQPVLARAPRSSSAVAFRRLAGEVLQRLAALRH